MRECKLELGGLRRGDPHTGCCCEFGEVQGGYVRAGFGQSWVEG